MGRVSLILPLSSASQLSPPWVARCRLALENAGHSVDVLAVLDPREPLPSAPSDRAWRWHHAGWHGLSCAAMSGLWDAESVGDYDALIVLDPAAGYLPEDLPAIVEPLAKSNVQLVVARRVDTPESLKTSRSSSLRKLALALTGRIAKPILGASDLFAGLIATTPEIARSVTRSFQPVGSRFAIDLLLRSKCQRAEVPIRVESPPASIPLRFDDLRHIKRLADDRFGNISRLIQFCAVGASGMIVDLTFYALFQLLFKQTWLANHTTPFLGSPLDLAAAGALAIALALTWNFSLNRRLTFNYARQGSIARQYLTYALSNALGIALSFFLRLWLPGHVSFFRYHKLAAAVVGIVTATGISFTMSRWLVFSHRSLEKDLARAETRATSTIPQTSSQ